MKTMKQILDRFKSEASIFISLEKTQTMANEVVDNLAVFAGQQRSFQAFIEGARYGYKLGQYAEFLNHITEIPEEGEE